MIDHRRLRFSDITGLERRDLPLACEIWLEDIFRAVWINRESMKLAAYFVRYISRPDANALTLRDIENQCQLNAEEVRKSLVLMRTFGAVEGYLIDRNDIRVGLRLSFQQRLRVLEMKQRFAELLCRPASSSWPWSGGDEKWVPSATPATASSAGPTPGAEAATRAA